MGLYPKGEYPHNTDFICGVNQSFEGVAAHAICIIDNPHTGRPHWGPDRTGVYRQWGLAGAESTTKERG